MGCTYHWAAMLVQTSTCMQIKLLGYDSPRIPRDLRPAVPLRQKKKKAKIAGVARNPNKRRPTGRLESVDHQPKTLLQQSFLS